MQRSSPRGKRTRIGGGLDSAAMSTSGRGSGSGSGLGSGSGSGSGGEGSEGEHSSPGEGRSNRASGSSASNANERDTSKRQQEEERPTHNRLTRGTSNLIGRLFEDEGALFKVDRVVWSPEFQCLVAWYARLKLKPGSKFSHLKVAFGVVVGVEVGPYTLHLTSYTLRLISYILHHTPCTIHLAYLYCEGRLRDGE